MAVQRTYPDAESMARQALAALATPSQHTRLIQLDAPVQGLVVERFEGSEAVCAPFRFEVDVLATSAFLDPDELLGKPLALRLARAGGQKRRWHGLCTAVAPLGGDGGLARYRLLIEPWTALLTHRRNALVFQDLDLHGVLEQLFADYPQADWRFDVTRRLPVRAITTQYRETDWEFATRLLADAGLAWRYEHAQAGGEGAEAGHTLVIFDQQAEVPEGRKLRFHRIDATERDDAVSAFTRQRRLVPNRSQVGSWHGERLASTTGGAEADAGGMPVLEVFTQPADRRFEDSSHAQAVAGQRLDAMRLPQDLYAGSGSVRDLAAGVGYSLVQHAVFEGAGFVPLNVVHVGVNNLGAGVTALLAAPELEHGSYRNRFVAAPAGVPVAPLPRPRPTVHGPQTARVVGLSDAAVTSTRDHQVRIQFAWQRGPAPNPGGLADTASSHPGHAPGDHTSGTWVPVAEWIAGPNWGSHFLPRIGAEVLVEFAHGDIDQPRITGQLYNGEVAPPFGGGIDGPDNHPGTLSGLHTQSHDGAGTQHWLIDDTPGQLRTRLHTSLADSRLELGYLVDHQGSNRGALRGEGVELAAEGWGNVRAGQGLLLSTTARPEGVSTQMDMAEAVGQLKGAERTAGALHDTLEQQQVPGLGANERLTALREAVDPDDQGRYSGSVNGQSAMKPAPGSREPGEDPVERFADPRLVAESPESLAFATQKSAVAFAGGSLHLTAQQDAQLSAGHTISSVSGQHAALYAHAGPIRAIAANGPVSLQAHTGELEVLADQSVTVTATDERIDVLAKEKIVLQAGETKVTLEGGEITFECPGNFTVKGAQVPFKGGVPNVGTSMDALPNKLFSDAIHCFHPQMAEARHSESRSSATAPQPLRADVGQASEHVVLSVQPSRVDLPRLMTCSPALSEHHELNFSVCLSGDYYETDASGLQVIDEGGNANFLPYSSWAGIFDLEFLPEERRLVATARVRVKLKDWVQVEEHDRETMVMGSDGRPISWPFSHDQVEALEAGRLQVKEVDRAGEPNLSRIQAQIESIIGKDQYYLEPAGCSARSECSCRILIEFELDLRTDHTLPHATINLFPTALRANSGNLGEVNVVANASREAGAPLWVPVSGPDNVTAHEAGHWFGWPDEYFIGGGAVHRRYINEHQLIDVELKEPEDEWKRFSATNLMGNGVYSVNPVIPSYYMNTIRDWLKEKTGLGWVITA